MPHLIIHFHSLDSVSSTQSVVSIRECWRPFCPALAFYDLWKEIKHFYPVTLLYSKEGKKKKRREYACVFIASMCASLHVITWDVLNITACGFLLDSDGVQGTLSLKVHIVKAMVFLVVMYECESWTIKAEHPRICFWIVLLEKTLESPLDCKEIK